MTTLAERPDLRVAKGEATRTALATVAFDLARRHGLDGVTVDDIARAADVSRRTFFNHYGSKEEAVSEVVRHRVRALLEGIDLRPDGHGAGRAALDVAVRRLVAPAQVAEFRDLIALAEAHPALVPHLARVQNDAADTIAATLRADRPGAPALSVVLAYALPGAVMSAVCAVYTGGIRLLEIDGPANGAITVDELVARLLDVMPTPADMSPADMAPADGVPAEVTRRG